MHIVLCENDCARVNRLKEKNEGAIVATVDSSTSVATASHDDCLRMSEVNTHAYDKAD